MKVVLRFDASSDIGLGHLYRMLSLGQVLKECLGTDGNILYATNSDGYTRKVMQEENVRFTEQGRDSKEDFIGKLIEGEKPDVIVFDQRYSYKKKDIIHWKNKTRLVSIDHIGEDYRLIDKIIMPQPHFERTKYSEYSNIVSGAEYTIINKNVLKFARQKDFPEEIKRIVVTTGGSDPKGVMIKLISWLREMNLHVSFSLLVGQAFKFKSEIKRIGKSVPHNFHVMPYSLLELVKGDIAICTFGLTIYEMIYLRIPAICICHNKEDVHSARLLNEKYGLTESIGYIEDINSKKLFTSITNLLSDKAYRRDMVQKCGNLVDGEGAKRVAQIIIGMYYV